MDSYMQDILASAHWGRLQSGDVRKVKRERRKMLRKVKGVAYSMDDIGSMLVLMAHEKANKPKALRREALKNKGRHAA